MSRALRLFCLAAFAVTFVHNVDAHNGGTHSTIKFAPCPEDATLECGKLTLPINHAKPHANDRGATFDMAVVRARATDPEQRIGVLVVNPGGPGASGVDFILSQSRTPFVTVLRQRFDLVSFDVRGSRGRFVRDAPGCNVRIDVSPARARDASRCLDARGIS